MNKIKDLNTQYIGKNILVFNVLDSTNTTAKENSHMPEGTVIVAKKQLKGRGRGDRKWHSDDYGALYFSLLLKPEIEPEELSRITLVAGLSVANAIEKVSGICAGIKWPNDILINSKKVSGILTELYVRDDKKCVILGIGINVENGQFPDEISDIATSVGLESGRKILKEDILKGFLEEFEKAYEIFLKYGFSAFKNDYEKKCVTLKRDIRVITPGEEYLAYAVGITDNGELICKRDGKDFNVSSGEVSVRGIL